MEEMQAVAVFPAAREVRLIEHPEPSLTSPGHLKLRILEIGVCGTDRELCDFRFGRPPAGSDHFILGHESLAEVVETGGAVSSFRPGDLVVPVVRQPCPDPACLPCRAGRQDFCHTGHYRERGILGMHGFMTEYVLEEARFLYLIPPELRHVAVLVEPLTIAQKAWFQFQAIDARLPWPKPRRTAVVLGAGPVGLLGAMRFRAAGFDTWVYSRSPAPNPKAAIAQAIGARYLSSQETGAREFAAQTGQIDVVYEAMGAAQTAFDLLPFLGPNGVFVFTGVPPAGQPLSLDLHRLLLRLVVRNQVIVGTVNAGPDAFAAAIRDLSTFHAQWPGALAAILTGRHPITAFREAIHGGGIKNVIAIRPRTCGTPPIPGPTSAPAPGCS